MARSRVRKVSARAQAGRGREVQIDTSTPTLVPGADQEWFGPGNPLRPVAPPSVAGRRFDFQFGTNINVTPRQSETFSFATLRTLADRHDLTRLAIETCKDRMIRLKWGFRVLDSDDDMSPEQESRSDALRKMLRRPDGRNFWVDWLRMVLEDLLVIDAPSIYVRRTMDETEVVGLVQIDGATIKPIIDAHGNEPDLPYPAFQQVLHGMPAVDYTRDQLLYAPRNRRVHRVYGFSPVEQIVATINIALRRQVWQHSYFTSGNIPDALIGVPSTWTPDQIRDFQDWFDGVLVGNPEKRRNGIFVPGEVAKSYVPTKDAEMFGAAEEWLARVVCFCFGIPHQALVKEVNRATADSAYEQAIEDGLAPVMAWVKSFMDRILIDVLGEEELEFWWIKDEAIDPKVQDEIWKGRVDAGSHTRNEWRVAVGDKPRHEPEADRLLYMGKPLGVAEQIEDQKTRMDSGVFPEAVGGDDKDDSSGDVVASEGKDDAEEDEEASKAASSTTTREGEHCRPFGGAQAGDKFSDDGDGLVLEKKTQPRHPKGSSKGGQFVSTGAGKTKAPPKPKINVHQNKDGSHTVYVNGKKDFKGTKAQAEAHVKDKYTPKPVLEKHTIDGKVYATRTNPGGTVSAHAPGQVEIGKFSSKEAALDAIKAHANPPLPSKLKAAGKKVEIHANKDGSHTVYVNGKKETKGTKEQVDAYVKATILSPKTAPTPAVQPLAPTPSGYWASPGQYVAGGVAPPPLPKATPPAPAAVSTGADKARGDRAHDVAAKPPVLTPSEKMALRAYTGSSYASINSALRKGVQNPALKETITLMDSAFAKASTTEAMMVFRGMKPGILDGLAKGSTFVDKGFTSTSTNIKQAQGFSGGGTIMKINVPKGSRAISLRKNSKYAEEQEILVKRGGRYRIRGVEQHTLDTGTVVTVVGVDYVG
jgi:hypothetical protein